MSIPRLDDFLQYMNTMNEDSVKKAYNDLKQILIEAIDAFTSNYVSDNDFTTFENSCKNLLSIGYIHLFKINSLLDILIIIDKSQTNKYIYQECLEYKVGPNNFTVIIHDIYVGKYDSEIQQKIALSEIHNNYSSSSELIEDSKKDYSDIIQLKKNMILFEKINILNHHINLLILEFVKLNIKIKSISFNSNSSY